MKTHLALFVLLCPLSMPAAAQETQDIGAAANDPTASITSYQFQDFYTYNYHNSDDASTNLLQFRAAIPFELSGYGNIFRATIPYVTDSLSGLMVGET